MSKISERKFQIYLGIGTTITPFLISAFIDKFKEVPFTTTFVNWIKWIWVTIFEHEFKVWHILLGIVLLFTLLLIMSKKQNPSVPAKKTWLDYTKDEFNGMKYRWRWVSTLGGKYQVHDLKPICMCGTSMKLNETFYQSDLATCPRCNSKVRVTKSLSDIEAIIIDNLDRDLYLDKI